MRHDEKKFQKWCLVWRPTFSDTFYVIESYLSEIRIVQLPNKRAGWKMGQNQINVQGGKMLNLDNLVG